MKDARSVQEIEAEMAAKRKSGDLKNMGELHGEWKVAKKSDNRRRVSVSNWVDR